MRSYVSEEAIRLEVLSDLAAVTDEEGAETLRKCRERESFRRLERELSGEAPVDE